MKKDISKSSLFCFATKLLEHCFRLSFRLLPGAGIIDDIVRVIALLIEGHLALQSDKGLLTGQSVPLLEARELLMLISIHDDDPVHVLMKAGFEEQGCIEHGDRLRLLLGESLHPGVVCLEHPGMETGIEPRSLTGVIEHDLTELSAVDTSVLEENFLSKMTDDLFPDLLPRRQQFVDDPVSVYDMSAEVPERAGYESFTAGNTARKANKEHGLSLLYGI